jgi:hypothetical protein
MKVNKHGPVVLDGCNDDTLWLNIQTGLRNGTQQKEIAAEHK